MIRSTISKSTFPIHEIESLEMLDKDDACSMMKVFHRMSLDVCLVQKASHVLHHRVMPTEPNKPSSPVRACSVHLDASRRKLLGVVALVQHLARRALFWKGTFLLHSRRASQFTRKTLVDKMAEQNFSAALATWKGAPMPECRRLDSD